MAVDYSLTKLGRRDDKADPGRKPESYPRVDALARQLMALSPMMRVGRPGNTYATGMKEEMGNYGVMGRNGC